MTSRVPGGRRFLTVALITLTAASCASPLPDPAGEATLATPSRAPAPVASPAAALPQMTDEDLQAARRFRQTFGLRADDAWIRAVFAAPNSEAGRLAYGVPLTPAELSDLLGRTARPDVEQVVRWFGERSPETWAGMFTDQAAGGVLVAQFTDAEAQRLRLAPLLPPDATVQVRQVRYSLKELQAHVEALESRPPALEPIGAQVYTAEVSLIDNVVNVLVDSNDPDNLDRVHAFFGRPGWMRVVWNGPLRWTGPRGDLDVKVVDARGAPLAGYGCSLDADNVKLGEDLITTGRRGHCRFRDIAATGFRVLIKKPTPDGYDLVGEGLVEVEPGEVTSHTVVIDTR